MRESKTSYLKSLGASLRLSGLATSLRGSQEARDSPKRSTLARQESSTLARQESSLARQASLASGTLSQLLKVSKSLAGSAVAGESEAKRQPRKVASFEELFKEADRLNDLFQHKLFTLCAQHGGKFHRAPVKKEGRALQKVVRSYQRKWRMLTDLVRTSLEFRRITDMTACLDAIGEDPEIVVLRTSDAKMRLRESFDAEQTGGYRDIQLSVRLDSLEARERGVHQHVAEVQLHLEALHQLKHEGGHRAYIIARNLRAD